MRTPNATSTPIATRKNGQSAGPRRAPPPNIARKPRAFFHGSGSGGPRPSIARILQEAKGRRNEDARRSLDNARAGGYIARVKASYAWLKELLPPGSTLLRPMSPSASRAPGSRSKGSTSSAPHRRSSSSPASRRSSHTRHARSSASSRSRPATPRSAWCAVRRTLCPTPVASSFSPETGRTSPRRASRSNRRTSAASSAKGCFAPKPSSVFASQAATPASSFLPADVGEAAPRRDPREGDPRDERHDPRDRPHPESPRRPRSRRSRARACDALRAPVHARRSASRAHRRWSHRRSRAHPHRRISSGARFTARHSSAASRSGLRRSP